MGKVTHEYLDKLIEEHPKLVQPREVDLEMYKLAKRGLVNKEEWTNLTKLFQMHAVIAAIENIRNDLAVLCSQMENKTIKKVLATVCESLEDQLKERLKDMEKFANDHMPGKDGKPT